MATHTMSIPGGDEPGRVWTHPTQPIWVNYFPAVEGIRSAHYIPYRAVAKVPAGRDPSTVDNRRIGSDRGFASLDAAVAAAEGAAA